MHTHQQTPMHTTVPAPCQQLLLEWSNPAPLAHAAWFADLPQPLWQQAMAHDTGRRFLGRRLRAQVPLPTRWRADPIAVAPWALGDLAQLLKVVDHAGWLLLRPAVQRVVARRQVSALVAWVGREAYEEALSNRPSFWLPSALGGDELIDPSETLNDQKPGQWLDADLKDRFQDHSQDRSQPVLPDDLPDLAQAAALSTPGQHGALNQATRHAGWCALNQVLNGPLQVLRARLHLLAGPDSAQAAAQQPWPIHGPALLQHLREQFSPHVVETWH
jgi:hypothetical protein